MVANSFPVRAAGVTGTVEGIITASTTRTDQFSWVVRKITHVFVRYRSLFTAHRSLYTGPMESLHNHTTLSDGSMNHEEIFDQAERLGFSIFAFTDHDALPSDDTLALFESWRGRKTKWIIGIEITSGLPKDMGGGSIGDFHIIGLFVDPKNAALFEHCRKAQTARRKRMTEMVENLQGLGFRISVEDCLRASGGDSVGRPHIVAALSEYPENAEIIENIRHEMESAAKNDSELARKYAFMMEKGVAQYPYTLFLSRDAFKNTYVEHLYIPDMDEAVRLIRDAGGIASIAHYFSIAKKVPLEKIRSFAANGRIDAVETVWNSTMMTGLRKEELEGLIASLRTIVRETGILETGGADAHVKEDLEYFTKNAYGQETVSMTTRILAGGKVDKQRSSL